MTYFRLPLLTRLIAFGFATLATMAQAHPDSPVSATEDQVLANCEVSNATSNDSAPNEIQVVDSDFSVSLRYQAVISGRCAEFTKSHVMGHVYFYGGATASIGEDGSLIRRAENRSSAKKSEHICDDGDHSLVYAALVAPTRLIERRDAKYVGVFKDKDTWFVAAFETDTDGKILNLERFLESEREITAVGYFPSIDTNSGTLGVTMSDSEPQSMKLLTFAWYHHGFG